MDNLVIIGEVQIDFVNVIDAEQIKNYCETELDVCGNIFENGKLFTLSVYDVPEDKLSAIRRRCAINKFTCGTVKAINKSRDAIVGAADLIAYNVAAPIAQAGIKATAGVAKVVAKTTIATGATLIGSSLEAARKTAIELKTDREMIHAKDEIVSAWKTMKKILGGTSSSKDFRIVEK